MTGTEPRRNREHIKKKILLSGIEYLILEQVLVESPGFLPQVGKKPVESKPFSYVALTVERVRSV